MSSSLSQRQCPHRPDCPGCPRFGIEEIAEAPRLRLEQFCSQTGSREPQWHVGVGVGHRHRARLAVRGTWQAPQIGIFRRQSHRVVQIDRCVVHAPAINRVAALVRQGIVETQTSIYSEETHRGLLRYLQLVVERASGRVQLTVITSALEASSVLPLLEWLARHVEPEGPLHSLHWNGQPERSNTILGPHWQHFKGPRWVAESLGGARCYFPPGAFGQANLPLFERLLGHVQGWIGDSARVLELYCGVGAFGLGLIKRGVSVTFNEVAPESLRGLVMGIENLGNTQRAIEVLRGTASEVIAAGALNQELTHVLVDPPRKGLTVAVRQALVERSVPELLYVSCGLDSFLADAKVLQAAYELTECHGYALFPYTEHVETVARFRRRI